MRTIQERLRTEDTVEECLRQRVKAHRGLCFKLPAMWYAGIPDRMVLLPGGRIFFVELKRPVGGRFEPLQKGFHVRLRRLGFHVHVWHTRSTIDAFFKELE